MGEWEPEDGGEARSSVSLLPGQWVLTWYLIPGLIQIHCICLQCCVTIAINPVASNNTHLFSLMSAAWKFRHGVTGLSAKGLPRLK